MWKTVKYNLIVLLVLLVLTEIVLWFFPVPDPYENAKQNMFYPPIGNMYIESQFDPNLKLQFATEEGLLGFENYKDTTNFTINNYGFRGDKLIMPKPSNEYRIFAIGGSSTESLYIDDADVWTQVLQENLNRENYQNKIVKVYNAGKSGDNIQDHIAMLSHRIIHLQPDEVIVFCGINDVTRLMLDDNPLKFNTTEKKDNNVGFGKMLGVFLYEFQIPRRLYYAFKSEEDALETIEIESNYQKKVKKTQARPVENQLPTTDYGNYANKVKTLIGICRANNIKLIFATQVVTWDTEDKALQNWHWMTSRGGVRYNAQKLQQKVDSINDVTINESMKFGVPVFKTDSIIPKTSDYLYDDCHFNPAGNKKMGEELATFIKTLNQ
ncbi:GDSL-like lipase/acylhydrolase family protein [Kordia periserrulae]|uniref:GDSL-like lipase/acylhydrolase family protein n=1 Tax=Kordia periserrulae TaxID=701523 RepID=A0A2T6BZL4_9FLAO|nr:GDSL-type esterase/lipase family protein [Kordia periserrulae]PTX61505.1 GDSL-like lipase/acylhydrolase family protein [Kordia periserrulae]